MSKFIPYYDVIEITFKDDTTDLINVMEDDDIQDAIVDHCGRQGWSSHDVKTYYLKHSVMKDADGREHIV